MKDDLDQLLKNLRLGRIAQILDEEIAEAEKTGRTHRELLARLFRAQWHHRQETALAWRITQARLPENWTLESFPFKRQPGVQARQIRAFAELDFIPKAENLVFIGPPGVGKTHLAIGIANKALDAGYKVLFRSALELVEELEIAEMKGELKKKLAQLTRFDLLVIDELGYLPMSRQARYNLFQLVHSFYEYRSLILTTNKDFTDWGEFFHNDNVAVPIIDRVIHHSNIFILGGESYRLKQKTLS